MTQPIPAPTPDWDVPQLPPGFRFGASTASFQIEGATAEGGRGPSVWDTFCARPGAILDGSNGDVACDHFHRYPEDVALLQRLGVGGYRLSVAWSRIQPDGTGPANAAGLDFYDRLIEELLAAGIAPMVTLFHWDLPQALEDRGGWLERDTVERFADYATILGDRFGDRVEMWAPVNEPNVHMMLGHALGTHAPGRSLGYDALPVAHHLNLAHGVAVQALREAGAAKVGTAVNHTPIWSLSDAPEDVAAAELYDTLWNRLYADPVLLGRYPDGFAELLPIRDGDLALIGAPLDFYGINYYNPTQIGAPGAGLNFSADTGEVGAGSEVADELELPFSMHPITGFPTTDFGWPVVPDGLREVLVQLKQRYPDIPPIHVTENGCSSGVGPDADGVVDDQFRVDYYDAHLRAVVQAIEEGVEVAGYYAWSLLDNFEWAEGYSQRFGLIWVDFETQQRIPKASYEFYRRVIAGQPGTETTEQH